jgi:hypothetical protein
VKLGFRLRQGFGGQGKLRFSRFLLLTYRKSTLRLKIKIITFSPRPDAKEKLENK